MVKHTNIIEMKESFETQSHIFIVMELMADGDLANFDLQDALTGNQIATIINQLLQAIKYLHSMGIIHRDIKPDNILIEKSKKTQKITRIKLTDFGFAKTLIPGQTLSQCCGTPAFIAPEILGQKGYGKSVDLWAAGVILYYLICQDVPFHSNDK